MKPKIILASTSPRRKTLLTQIIGNNYEVIPSKYEEDNTLELSPEELVKTHALGKGKDVANHQKSGIIIASDTLVVYNKKILGKPQDEYDAKEMLEEISGKIIEVVTGLCVINKTTKKAIVESETVKLRIKTLSEGEIEDYIKTGEPLDKAGAFGAQGRGAIFIEKVEGDYFSIPGLPLFKLNKILNHFGISIFDYN